MRTRILIPSLIALLLCGCVNDQLLRRETQRFTEASTTALKNGEQFYDELIAVDRSRWAVLQAIDTNCVPPSLGGKVFLNSATATSTTTSAPARMCVPEATVLSPKPIPEIDRRFYGQEFALLGFVASYTKALAELAGDPELKAAEGFEQAKADLDVLLSRSGTESPLNDDQTKVLKELVSFVDELAKESGRAKAIRKILDEKSAAAAEKLRELAQSLKRDESHKVAASKLEDATIAYAIKTNRGDPSLRLALMHRHYLAVDAISRNDRTAAAAKQCQTADNDPALSAQQNAELKTYCGFPAAGLMFAASLAHNDLVNLADGALNERQRAAQAALAYRQFIRIAKLFVSLAAF